MGWDMLGLIIWLVCAIFSASVYLAHAQREWPSLAVADYENDKRAAWIFGLLFGPASVPAAILGSLGLKHGFMNPFKQQKPKD